MNTFELVLEALDEALELQGRALNFTPETPLLGALPELDSMAVISLISALEARLGARFDDSDISGSAFATVGSLVDLVDATRAANGA